MKGKIKTARRKASKLHGAEATFVSLVDAGANETPFTLIKSQDGAKAMPIKKRGKQNAKKSHKTTRTAKKGASPETTTETLIAKMVFDGELFEDEAAVQSYLDDAEWDAEKITIEKNDDGDWEARPNDLTDDDFTKLAKVELGDDADEGIEAYVGKREVEAKSDDDDADDDEGEEIETDDEASTETKSDDDDEDDDEDEDDPDDAISDTETKKAKKKPYSKTKKAAAPKSKLSKRQQFLAKRKEERAKEVKFDQWDAYFSKGNTLSKALQDGMKYDGTPPGYGDVQAAFTATMSNIVADDGMGDGKQEALNKAAMDFAEIVGGLDTFFDAYVGSDEETIAKSFEDEGAREHLAKWAEDFADFQVAGENTDERTTSKKSLQSTASEPDLTNVVSMVQKALEPLNERLEDLGETVEAISTRAPTKKAADASDGDPAAPRKVEKKRSAEKQRKAETDEYMQDTVTKSMFG